MAQSGMAGVKNISQSRAYGEQTAGQPVRAKQFAETYKGEDSEARVGNRAYEKAAGGNHQAIVLGAVRFRNSPGFRRIHSRASWSFRRS